MSPFYYLFTFLFICCFCDSMPIKSNQKNSLFFGSFLTLSLFAGLHYNFPDYEAYQDYFKLLNNNILISSETDLAIVASDRGYIYINKIIGICTDNPVFLFLVMAFLSVGINLSCYKKYTPYFFTAILFYYVHTYIGREMMQIRAGLACALCLYSIRYIVDKRPFHFLCIVILASTIHLAALVFIISYFLSLFNFKIKTLKYFVSIALLIGIFIPLGQFLKALPYMEGLDRIQNYSEWEAYNGNLGVFSNPTVLKQLIIVVISLKFYDRLKDKVYAFNIILTIYTFSVCWLIVWNDFGIVAARIATFFSIGEVLLVASFYHLFSSKKTYTFIIGIGSLIFLTLNLVKNSLIYQSILLN